MADIVAEEQCLSEIMNENKKVITSMRLSEDDIEKFKKFADQNGFTQQQAFNSLIAMAEIEKAKVNLSDRGKEIDTFRDLSTKLVNMFINSLEMNVTAEDTIREELSKELKSKDESIIFMSEQIENYKQGCNELSQKNKDITSQINALNDTIRKLNNDLANNEKQINTLNSNNAMLQGQLQDFKQYKESYKSQQTEIRELTSKLNAMESEKLSMKNSNELLNNMLGADKEQLLFYKNELEAKKTEIEQLRKEIININNDNKLNNQAILENHKKEISELKKELANNLNAIESQYKEKLDMEIQKKDLEIAKLIYKNDNGK